MELLLLIQHQSMLLLQVRQFCCHLRLLLIYALGCHVLAIWHFSMVVWFVLAIGIFLMLFVFVLLEDVNLRVMRIGSFMVDVYQNIWIIVAHRILMQVQIRAPVQIHRPLRISLTLLMWAQIPSHWRHRRLALSIVRRLLQLKGLLLQQIQPLNSRILYLINRRLLSPCTLISIDWHPRHLLRLIIFSGIAAHILIYDMLLPVVHTVLHFADIRF